MSKIGESSLFIKIYFYVIWHIVQLNKLKDEKA